MKIVEKAIRFEGKYEGDRAVERNIHSYSVIGYIKKGEVKLYTNNQEYELKENSIYILNPFEEYFLQYGSLEYEYITVYINPLDLEALQLTPNLSIVLKNRPLQFQSIINDVEQSVYDILIQCVKEYEAYSSCPYQNNRMAHLISDLLILLYRQFPDIFLYFQGNEKLMSIQGYMEQHYNERIKITQLSDDFQMNQFYFSHSFKSFSGYSPKQYLTKIQFIHVCQRLLSSSLTIGEIAEQTGFESINDLSRKFKQTFSLSPSDFRKNHSI